MSSSFNRRVAGIVIAGFLAGISGVHAKEPDRDAVRRIVDEAIEPLMAQHAIPGMAIAVTIGGKRHFIEYGVAARDPSVPVTRDTLFELGSISKTFTATLATYAAVEGKLSLADPIGRHMPELAGSPLGDVPLLHLGTHTAGGFPLQLPEAIKGREQLMAYYRDWKPQYAPGTRRSYANPSIGLLGLIAARSLGTTFDRAVERQLFPGLGMKRSYVNVPPAQMTSYAWGYGRDGNPVRVSPALLATEAYGVKSNAVDMVRFVELNMGVGTISEKLARALAATHVGYYRAGELVQNLIWEQYPYPVDLAKIVAGNATRMIMGDVPATAIEPPMAAGGDVIVNKTGSTNGFGAYVAFVPGRKIGAVMLANRNFPNEFRVRAVHRILSRLAE